MKKFSEEEMRKLAKQIEESNMDEQTSMDMFNANFKEVERKLAEERKKKLRTLLGE